MVVPCQSKDPIMLEGELFKLCCPDQFWKLVLSQEGKMFREQKKKPWNLLKMLLSALPQKGLWRIQWEGNFGNWLDFWTILDRWSHQNLKIWQLKFLVWVHIVWLFIGSDFWKSFISPYQWIHLLKTTIKKVTSICYRVMPAGILDKTNNF